MLKPGSGALYLDGVNVAEFPDAARSRLRAEYFGFVFQDAALDATRTILDNVVEAALYRGQSRTEAKNRARALMSRFGVDLGESIKPAQISGGQAQRLSLCRALLNDPRYLLADEPTGNLDAKSADIVVAGLREQADAGSVVIVVTHDPSLVDRCDREIVL
jgi:ABC-type lipoprotein export system ATPase subunit